MPEADKREQYQTRYATFSEAGININDGDNLLVDNLDAEGQITAIDVYCTEDVTVVIQADSIDNGEDAVPFDPTVSTAGSATPKYTMAGNSEYSVGNFEDPAIEVGSRQQVQVTVPTSPADGATIAVNIRTDEHLG